MQKQRVGWLRSLGMRLARIIRWYWLPQRRGASPYQAVQEDWVTGKNILEKARPKSRIPSQMANASLKEIEAWKRSEADLDLQCDLLDQHLWEYGSDEQLAAWRSLTPREQKMVLLYTAGWTEKDVLDILKISRATLYASRASLYQKVGVKGKASLVYFFQTERDTGL